MSLHLIESAPAVFGPDVPGPAVSELAVSGPAVSGPTAYSVRASLGYLM